MSDLEEYLLVVDEPKYIKEFYDMRGAEARAIDYVLIIEQFQKLLGVYTATEALAKVAELMQNESRPTKSALDGAKSRPEIDFSDVGVGYDDDVPE